MALQTVYFKEHQGVVPNSIGQLSSVPSGPWWGGFGSQPVSGDSCAQPRTFCFDQSSNGEQLASPKQAKRGGDQQGYEKGNLTLFTIFPGDCKDTEDGLISLQSYLPEHRTRFEMGFGQPTICAKYPCVDQCYGIFSSYGSQVSGRIMLPLSLTTDDGTIYVNAKQYHGIIRRRLSRARAVMANKRARTRKPYMHESRHLHAMRRPRGSGGRFLNTKNSNNNGKIGMEAGKAENLKCTHSTGSQSSEVLQSESGTLNSSKEAQGGASNHSGSEVTSTYSQGDLDCFRINDLTPSLHPFSNFSDHGLAMATKWVGAAGSGCNLRV